MWLTGRNGKEQKPVPTQLVQRRKSDTTVKTKTGLFATASVFIVVSSTSLLYMSRVSTEMGELNGYTVLVIQPIRL